MGIWREYFPRTYKIEDNHIHDLGKGWLSDFGAIYTLGVQPGTVIRGNHIHDIKASRYGGSGIYLDEGSSEILVENNLCYRFTEAPFAQHYGRENIVRNNIFAFGDLCAIKWGVFEKHAAFILERNILISDGPAFFHSAKGNPWPQGSMSQRPQSALEYVRQSVRRRNPGRTRRNDVS